VARLPEKPRGAALLYQRSNSQLRYSSRSRDILRCLHAAGFDSRFRRDDERSSAHVRKHAAHEGHR